MPGVRQEVAELIPAGELQGGIAIQRMVAADFKIMRTLPARRCSSHRPAAPWYRAFSFANEIASRFGAAEHSAIKRVEHVRLIILIRSAQSRTDLAPFPQILYGTLRRPRLNVHLSLGLH